MREIRRAKVREWLAIGMGWHRHRAGYHGDSLIRVNTAWWGLEHVAGDYLGGPRLHPLEVDPRFGHLHSVHQVEPHDVVVSEFTT